ncbi:MAG: hypothetical protein KIT83_06365, partial [Bryobacterales bacterium]|nr:hypothetical protein [Bryobacterales bacterium]
MQNPQDQLSLAKATAPISRRGLLKAGAGAMALAHGAVEAQVTDADGAMPLRLWYRQPAMDWN